MPVFTDKKSNHTGKTEAAGLFVPIKLLHALFLIIFFGGGGGGGSFILGLGLGLGLGLL